MPQQLSVFQTMPPAVSSWLQLPRPVLSGGPLLPRLPLSSPVRHSAVPARLLPRALQPVPGPSSSPPQASSFSLHPALQLQLPREQLRLLPRLLPDSQLLLPLSLLPLLLPSPVLYLPLPVLPQLALASPSQEPPFQPDHVLSSLPQPSAWLLRQLLVSLVPLLLLSLPQLLQLQLLQPQQLVSPPPL